MGRKVKKSTKKYQQRVKKGIIKKKVKRPQNKKKQEDNEEQTIQQQQHQENEIKEKKKSEAQIHMEQLKELKNTQAEFFEFLEKEDAELLNFGQDEDLDEELTDEGEPVKQLTEELLTKWKTTAPTSLSSTAHLVKAFHTACHINDSAPDPNSKTKVPVVNFDYGIDDSSVFNEIMVFALKEMGGIFTKHLLNDSEDSAPNVQSDTKTNFTPEKYPRWKKTRTLVKLYIKAILHFLNNLVEENMITFLLKQTEKIPFYFGAFPTIQLAFLKKLLELWGSSTEQIRIISFLNIRQLAIHTPYPAINDCLKGIYIGYVRNTKFVNSRTMPLVNFLSNCVVELYGIDFSASYQHAFVYIRQLAVHLRTAYNEKTRDKHLTVYNWQTLNSLKVWVRVLCAYPKQEQLWLLAYPLIQIIQGFIYLVPTIRNYPLRCHCIRMLNDLARARTSSWMSQGSSKPAPRGNGDFYVNSAVYIIEMLSYPGFAKPPHPYSGKPISFTFILKVGDKLLGTKVFMDTVLHEIHELLLEFFVCYSRSISYPELILPAMTILKKFLKSTRQSPATAKLKRLVTSLQSQSQFILAQRNVVSYAPNDTAKLSSFLSNVNYLTPLEEYREQYITKQREQNTHEGEEDEDEEEPELESDKTDTDHVSQLDLPDFENE